MTDDDRAAEIRAWTRANRAAAAAYRTQYVCPDCGHEKSAERARCEECQRTRTRAINRASQRRRKKK